MIIYLDYLVASCANPDFRPATSIKVVFVKRFIIQFLRRLPLSPRFILFLFKTIIIKFTTYIYPSPRINNNNK